MIPEIDHEHAIEMVSDIIHNLGFDGLCLAVSDECARRANIHEAWTPELGARADNAEQMWRKRSLFMSKAAHQEGE